ncbi:hypothetical protein SEUCBS139899_004394 [Sporothrix eucalyptigena]|uniref:J domain-containing protein n=1 Tax=Sporothrix eucalyptigena TaxID=1812306 RepID=A0ABP0C521_9PEZI
MNPRSSPQYLTSSVFASAALFYRQGPAVYSSRTACRCSHLLYKTNPTTRSFSSSRRLFQDGPLTADGRTHYETLNVPFSADVADIKKSFFKLSKVHHPDRNPNDPNAPRRFMRISEAYAVLGHTEKRAVYDREVMRHHQHHHVRGQHRPGASYHSTGPAGGRPASGLSRRRSAFRGPPPSFYRNTGTGKGTAYSPDDNPSSNSSQQRRSSNTGPQYGPAGFGPGNVNANDPGTRSNPATPHFDWYKTERTHHNISQRVAERRAAAAHEAASKEETSMAMGFLIISAALVAGVLVPVMIFGDWKKETKQPRFKPKPKPDKSETAAA